MENCGVSASKQNIAEEECQQIKRDGKKETGGGGDLTSAKTQGRSPRETEKHEKRDTGQHILKVHGRKVGKVSYKEK